MNKSKFSIGLVILFVLSFSSCNSPQQSSNIQSNNAQQDFIDWGINNTVTINSLTPCDSNADLEKIADAIGEAKVVALSEGFHNCKEMMHLHERLIQYLITEKGFNTVITESGLPESRLVDNYIQGKDEAHVFTAGINKMYGAWQEGRSLIDWMRQYNAQNNNVLHYMGADIGGFYANWYPPIESIVTYLKKVDPQAAKALMAKLEPTLKIMGTKKARLNYSEKLSPLQKAELAITLEEAVELFDTNKEAYIAKWNEEEYEWARLSTVAMRMAENYYRNYGDQSGGKPHLYAGLNGRELMMSHNVLQRVKNHSDAKIILINHVVHTKTESGKQAGVWGYFTPMAQLIKDELGDDFFVIGMCYGGGQFWNKWQRPAERYIDTIQAPKADGMEVPMKALGKKQYFIHWETAPAQAKVWLNNSLYLRENDYYMRIRPAEWNACIYLDEVSPATPAN